MNHKAILWLVSAALVGAAVAVIAFSAFDGGEAPPPPEIGDVTAERRTAIPSEEAGEPRPAPNFTLETLEGGNFQLSDHTGEVIVLNFWATWCAPCRIEIPDLIELQDELGEEGVQVVGISLDHDGREIVEAFAEEVGFNYPIVLDDGDVAEQFGGVYALPTTIIIGPDGMIRRRIPGLVTKKLLRPILEDLARS